MSCRSDWDSERLRFARWGRVLRWLGGLVTFWVGGTCVSGWAAPRSAAVATRGTPSTTALARVGEVCWFGPFAEASTSSTSSTSTSSSPSAGITSEVVVVVVVAVTVWLC